MRFNDDEKTPIETVSCVRKSLQFTQFMLISVLCKCNENPVKMMVSLSLSPPVLIPIPWMILINEWTLQTVLMLFNLAGCVHTHYQELIIPPPRGHISVMSRTTQSWMAECLNGLHSQIVHIPQLLTARHDKGLPGSQRRHNRETEREHTATE